MRGANRFVVACRQAVATHVAVVFVQVLQVVVAFGPRSCVACVHNKLARWEPV